MAKILIAEDELPISNLIRWNLELVGHECSQVYDGIAAVREAEEGKYDLLLLDEMLPGLSGFEVIGQVGDLPVIFVTARAGAKDRVQGLRLGADDYIVKPFEILELVERVKAVLRRTKKEEKSFCFDDLRVEFDTKRVFRGGEEVFLKPKEFSLLETFITNRNLALSREKLLSLVWEYDYEGDERTVDIHVQRLRKKLGLSQRLKTVYKTGYRLEV